MISDEVMAAVVHELEQAIKTTAARDGINLDDPSLDIFTKQRADYAEWLRQVLPVAIAAEREACAKIASGDLVPILNDLGADGIKAAVRIAAAIRARGQTTPD